MGAIEFRAKVKEGKIEIPAKYRDQIKDQVRVILVSDDVMIDENNLIDILLANPLQIKGFSPVKREDLYER